MSEKVFVAHVTLSWGEKRDYLIANDVEPGLQHRLDTYGNSWTEVMQLKKNCNGRAASLSWPQCGKNSLPRPLPTFCTMTMIKPVKPKYLLMSTIGLMVPSTLMSGPIPSS